MGGELCFWEGTMFFWSWPPTTVSTIPLSTFLARKGEHDSGETQAGRNAPRLCFSLDLFR